MGSGFFLMASRVDSLQEAVFFFAGPIPFLLASEPFVNGLSHLALCSSGARSRNLRIQLRLAIRRLSEMTDEIG